MEKKGISQEWLKAIACVCMLIDHIGAVFLPYDILRVIGRISFPIYCFLLVEGVVHSSNLKKYGQRLLISALLSELPYDYLFYGRPNWQHQNVMVTLLLGFLMVVWARKRGKCMIPISLCFFAAEFLGSDYGGWGIALIGVFLISMEKSQEVLLQTIGMALIFWCMGSYQVSFGEVYLPIQMFGLLAMIPISLYSGKKATYSKKVQWTFYLFYPVHIAVLYRIKSIF